MNNDAYLDNLLDQWEEAVERGHSVDLESLCKERPELLVELKRKVSALAAMDARLEKIDGAKVDRTLTDVGSSFGSHLRTPRGPKTVKLDSTLSDLRYHARGGIGIVYQGHEDALNRYVAIKFINSRSGKDKRQCAKFRQEAEITARLDHPGVVPVYAIGESSTGQPFYAMRFIQGEPLDKGISKFHKMRSEFSFEENRVKENQILRQLVSACRTVAYAHTRGIVHRDIKPQNIMLGKYGETLVVDWGLALPIGRADAFRVENENTLRTDTDTDANMADGTPVYMSPEQASGKDAITPATDIYSLGATLYRMITGELVVDGDSLTKIKQNVIQGNIKRPREIDSSISKDMDSICMKALATNPLDRYQTAGELADDIERWMAEVPVEAHNYSAMDKGLAWARKRASLVRILATSFLVLTAASLIASALVWNISRENIQLQGDAAAAFSIARRNQRDNLKLLCQMTARSIQYELQSRIVALDELARGDEMVELLSQEALNENQLDKLNKIVDEYRSENEGRMTSNSWFVLDRKGKLIARSGETPGTVKLGQDRWTRPYFHGGEKNLDANLADADRPSQITKPNFSPVFIGIGPGRSLCSLSVPVESSSGEAVGVVGMTFAVGLFQPLETTGESVASKRILSIVETRGELAGVLVHHPGFKPKAETESLPMLNVETLDQVVEERNALNTKTLENYIDPVGGRFEGSWIAVSQPIRVKSRDGGDVTCGWHLIVQDRPYRVLAESDSELIMRRRKKSP